MMEAIVREIIATKNPLELAMLYINLFTAFQMRAED